MQQHKNNQNEVMIAYHNKPEEIEFISPKPERIRHILDRSVFNGIYIPPKVSGKVKRERPFIPGNVKEKSDAVKFNIEKLHINKGYLEIRGWLFPLKSQQEELSIGLLFASEKDSLVIPAKVVERKDVRQHFGNTYPEIPLNCGFVLKKELKTLKIQNGNYRLGICLLQDTTVVALKFAEQMVFFPEITKSSEKK
jgi:hypothetical protein